MKLFFIILIFLIFTNTIYASSNIAMSLNASIKKGADFISSLLKSGKNTAQTLNNAGEQITTDTKNTATKIAETEQNFKNNTNKLKKTIQKNTNSSSKQIKTILNSPVSKLQYNQYQTYNGNRRTDFTDNYQKMQKVIVKQSRPQFKANCDISRQNNKTMQNFNLPKVIVSKKMNNNTSNTYNNGVQKKTIVVKRKKHFISN